MIVQTAVALLAAIGTVFLVWYFCVWLPRPSVRRPLYLLARPQNEGELLEILSDLEGLRFRGIDVRLCLALDGLDEELTHLAQLMQKDNPAILSDTIGSGI